MSVICGEQPSLISTTASYKRTIEHYILSSVSVASMGELKDFRKMGEGG